MISERSRYSRGTTAWVDHPVQGRVQVVHLRPLIWTNYPYVDAVAVDGDSFDTLAHKRYGDPQAYWFIAEMNPHVVHPADLVAQTLLRIPAELMR